MGRALYSTYYTTRSATTEPKVSIVNAGGASENPIRSESPLVQDPNTGSSTPGSALHEHPPLTWDVAPFDPDSDEFFANAEFEAFIDSDDETSSEGSLRESLTAAPSPQPRFGNLSAEAPVPADSADIGPILSRRSAGSSDTVERPSNQQGRRSMVEVFNRLNALEETVRLTRETNRTTREAMEASNRGAFDSLVIRRATDTSTTTHTANNNRWRQIGDLPIWTRNAYAVSPPLIVYNTSTSPSSDIPSTAAQFPSFISSPPSSSELFNSSTPFNPHARALTSNPSDAPLSAQGLATLRQMYMGRESWARTRAQTIQVDGPLPNIDARVSHTMLAEL